MKLKIWDHVAILITAVQVALGAYVLTHGLEGELPMHFDVHGNVDRWGDRREVAILLFVCAALNMISHLVINWAIARAKPEDVNHRVLVLGRLVGFLTVGGISALFAAIGLGLFYQSEPQTIVRTILAATWILIAAVGVLCGKTTPNRWAGVRSRFTFESRLAWERSNRLLGRIYFFGGIAGLIATALVPQLWLAPVFLTVVLGGAAVAYWEAWRTWKSDPERAR